MQQTRLMPEITSAAEAMAWLEPVAADGQADQRIVLDTLPFRIGRVAPAELQIASGSVSREHAVVELFDEGFELRDLGSTNGTFVNGQQIDTTSLANGDLLTIADVEFTFLTDQAGTPGGMATQVIDSARETIKTYLDVVRDMRWQQERLMCRAVRCDFRPIVRLEDRRVLGYEALDGPEATLSAEGRIAHRLFQLQRLLSVEEAARLGEDAVVFVRIQPSEFGGEELIESLSPLRRIVGPQQRLAVELPDSVVSDTPYLLALRQRLRRDDILVAHDGFAAGAAALAGLGKPASNYLKLAASLVRDVHRNGRRRERMCQIVEAARAMETQVIATGVNCEEEAETSLEAGCELAQGNWFEDGGPAGASDVVRESRVETENLSD